MVEFIEGFKINIRKVSNIIGKYFIRYVVWSLSKELKECYSYFVGIFKKFGLVFFYFGRFLLKGIDNFLKFWYLKS